MSKIIAGAVAAFFVIGTAGVMAQNTPQDKAAPEATPKAPASGGAVRDDKPTDPNKPALTEIEKLKKDGQAGNKSTGN